MPYKLVKRGTGYKVMKTTEKDKYFSKRPLTKKKALKQLRAIVLNERRAR